AVASVVARAGNVSEKPLDLRVPPASRLLALCRADRVEVVVVDPQGTLSAEAQLQLSATVGTPGPLRRLAPGVFVSTLEVRDDQPGTESHVTAALADALDAKAQCT